MSSAVWNFATACAYPEIPWGQDGRAGQAGLRVLAVRRRSLPIWLRCSARRPAGIQHKVHCNRSETASASDVSSMLRDTAANAPHHCVYCPAHAKGTGRTKRLTRQRGKRFLCAHWPFAFIFVYVYIVRAQQKALLFSCRLARVCTVGECERRINQAQFYVFVCRTLSMCLLCVAPRLTLTTDNTLFPLFFVKNNILDFKTTT